MKKILVGLLLGVSIFSLASVNTQGKENEKTLNKAFLKVEAVEKQKEQIILIQKSASFKRHQAYLEKLAKEMEKAAIQTVELETSKEMTFEVRETKEEVVKTIKESVAPSEIVSYSPQEVEITEIVTSEATETFINIPPEPAFTNQIRLGGTMIPLVNGQGLPDAPSGYLAAYWMGTGNTQDGATTHIIGHNPGAFSVVMSLGVGAPVTVWDSNGNERTYTVYAVLELDDNSLDHNGVDHWNDMMYQSGESISLQTCIDDNWNRILLAR